MNDRPSNPLRSPVLAVVLLAIGWLVPGLCFVICGRWKRGLAHFLMIAPTFLIGIMLHSSVMWPIWSIRSPDFNLINNFTFIVQMGGGFAALASFWATTAPVAVEAAPPLFAWLAGVPHHPYYELGGYFLIVAGAMNYFALGNFYDRLIHPGARFEAIEPAAEEPAS